MSMKLFAEAHLFIQILISEVTATRMIRYYEVLILRALGHEEEAVKALAKLEHVAFDGHFTNRLADLVVLEEVLKHTSKDPYAYYLLGNI